MYQIEAAVFRIRKTAVFILGGIVIMRKCRKLLTVIGLGLMIASLAACDDTDTAGSVPADAASPAESTENVDDPDEGKGDLIVEEETEGSVEETVKEERSYASVYLKQIEDLTSEKLADQFMLANIDEDDVPELIASDSAGSFDRENAFIYTVHDGECVLLASAITGVDGASLSYCEGKNIILESGSIAGATDVFYEIKDGKLSEVFRAEMTDTLETDADDEEICKYSVNGNETDEKTYYEEFAKFAKEHEPLIRIDYDGLNTITYKSEQGSGWFEQTGSSAYKTADEITKEL